MKEQKKNKGSVLVAEPAYNSQNAQFDLVRDKIRKKIIQKHNLWSNEKYCLFLVKEKKLAKRLQFFQNA